MASWEDIAIDSSLALAEAQEENLDVVIADDYTLQLDLDSAKALKQFKAFHGRLVAHFGAGEPRYTVSRNGNAHAYVTLQKPLSVPERIGLQAALGSDPTREFLSLKRWLDGDPTPILLFETKPKAAPAAEGAI